MTTLRVVTRGSRLAMAQTELAIEALRGAGPSFEAEIVEVRTEGDRDQQTPLSTLGGRGVFVRAVEDALLDGRAEIAVHSLKDVPTQLAEGLTLGALLPRGDPRDALVAAGGRRLAELPDGARIGTGSRRRAALLLAMRPGLKIVEIRGNVDTRLRRVASGEYDGVLLAAAGLDRLGRLDETTQIFEAMEFLPAPGQGTVALQCRADAGALLARLAAVDDAPTRAAAEAERGFLAALGVGCSLPVAAYAQLSDGLLAVRGMVAGGEPVDGGDPTFDRASNPAVDPVFDPAFGDAVGAPAEAEALGRGLAERLLEAKGPPAAGATR